MSRRIASVDELVEWMDTARVAGASRFELWHKPRGFEQRRLEGSEPGADTWTVADQMLARVKAAAGDSRVTFAVLAFGDADVKPLDRVFVTADESNAMMTLNGAPSGDLTSASGVVLSSAFSMLQQMTAGTFATLQRETEQQRRTNESLVRTTTGSFETFARGYERTFADLQARLEAALKEAAELRARNDVLTDGTKQFEAVLAKYMEIITELEKREHVEVGEIEKKKQRRQFLMNKLELLVPVAMNKMMKGAGADPKGALDTSIIARFLASLSDEQKQQIAALLRPEQLLALLEVMQTTSGGDEATQQAKASGDPASVEFVAASLVRVAETLPFLTLAPVVEKLVDRVTAMSAEIIRKDAEEQKKAAAAGAPAAEAPAAASPANTNATPSPAEPGPTPPSGPKPTM